MQTLYGRDNNVDYIFVYMEKLKTILVWKDDELAYTIKVLLNGTRICDCWGNRRHGHCKHDDFCDEFNFMKIVKPRSFINKTNEEFIANHLIIEKEGFYAEKRTG